MNKRQKIIAAKLIIVAIATVLSAVAITNLKIIINKRESIRAMRLIGLEITNYKKMYISLPPEAFLDKLIQDLKVQRVLGEVGYRALWITADSDAEQILAYAEKKFRSPFIKDGCIVIRLNGDVEWMEKSKFDELLAIQQNPMELQTRMSHK